MFNRTRYDASGFSVSNLDPNGYGGTYPAIAVRVSDCFVDGGRSWLYFDLAGKGSIRVS